MILAAKEATVCKIRGGMGEYWIRTFSRQVELFELGSFLVKLDLQLLLEFDELSPLLLQGCHSLEHL